jgi:hypothetical protein
LEISGSRRPQWKAQIESILLTAKLREACNRGNWCRVERLKMVMSLAGRGGRAEKKPRLRSPEFGPGLGPVFS